MTIQIDGRTYDIEREQLGLLIERDSPAAPIARAMLQMADGEGHETDRAVTRVLG